MFSSRWEAMMEGLFRWACLAGALSLLLVALVPDGIPLLAEQQQASSVPLAGTITQWLAALRDAEPFRWALCLVTGLAAGSWIARALHGGRLDAAAEPAKALAEEMRAMLVRMRAISETCHASAYRAADMVMVYADYQALQLSLQRAGLRVPWMHWEPDQDPLAYLTANIGYLAFLEPLMRKGHLAVAIRTSRKSLDLSRAPRGPVMRMGRALRRLA